MDEESAPICLSLMGLGDVVSLTSLAFACGNIHVEINF
jgi:hypothetical protein